MNTTELSVIIPVKNEGGNIGSLLGNLRKVLADLRVSHEIIVIDGDSDDDTVAQARGYTDQLIVQKEPGYGNALKEGFARAVGEYILTMDGDLSHPTEFVRSMYHKRAEADLIIASRYIPGGTAEMPAWRKALSRILNVAFSTLLSLPIKDISSGYRLYRSSVLHKLELKNEDFSILEESAIKMWNRGDRIMEIPFAYRPRRHGCSKAKLLVFGKSYLVTAYLMWRLKFSGKR
jgi:dolichol-phosphate mannosyltransferase